MNQIDHVEVVMVAQEDFFSVALASDGLHPTLLFMVDHDLGTPKSCLANVIDLASRGVVFVRFFADKISFTNSNLEGRLKRDLAVKGQLHMLVLLL